MQALLPAERTRCRTTAWPVAAPAARLQTVRLVHDENYMLPEIQYNLTTAREANIQTTEHMRPCLHVAGKGLTFPLPSTATRPCCWPLTDIACTSSGSSPCMAVWIAISKPCTCKRTRLTQPETQATLCTCTHSVPSWRLNKTSTPRFPPAWIVPDACRSRSTTTLYYLLPSGRLLLSSCREVRR